MKLWDQLDEETQKTKIKPPMYTRINPFLRADGTHATGNTFTSYCKHIKNKLETLNGPRGYGVIVLDGNLHKMEHEQHRKACIKKFNKDSRVGILINTSRYREGISLQPGVYATHMIGMTNKTQLLQAAYRAIRNCSHRTQPFDSPQGWKLRLHMYLPCIRESKGGECKIVHPPEETDKEDMTMLNKILDDVAVDRELMKPMNDRSRKIEQDLALVSAPAPSKRSFVPQRIKQQVRRAFNQGAMDEMVKSFGTLDMDTSTDELENAFGNMTL
jgi:hypothetical protein